MVKPNKAFILAAGFGTRLRPYTDHCPKPMVEVAGRSLIWRTLDRLHDAGVEEVVVNTHYMADLLAQHMDDYMRDHQGMRVHVSYEEDILDTGGGINNALQYFDDGLPFYVIAGDALWEDGALSALDVLAQRWDGEKMDILTLMQPLSRMTGGVGDFDLLEDGRVRRSKGKSGAYMWTNIRLNTPEIYREAADTAFSVLPIMDACEESGRFYALEHVGDWHHISTPKDLERVDEHFRAINDKNGVNS